MFSAGREHIFPTGAETRPFLSLMFRPEPVLANRRLSYFIFVKNPKICIKKPKTRPVYSASGDEVHGFPRSDTVTLADAQEDELWPGTFMPGQVAPKL